MKPSVLVLGIAFFANLLFVGCASEDVIDFNQDIDVTIQGIVYDNNGNVPLSGVKVSLGEDTVSTTEDGVYSFTGNVSGSYLLKFEKTAYATMVQQVFADGTDFTANAIVSTSPIFMFEQDQTLTTKLQVSNGIEVTPATDVAVTVELDSYSSNIFFENSVFETTSDSEGNITVGSLPDQFVTISVNFTDGDDAFTLNVETSPADAAICYTLSESSLSKFDLVDTNVIDDNGDAVTDFTSSSDITFTFSDALDADYELMDISLDKSSFLDVGIETSISGSTLTIDPLGTDLEEGASYTVGLFVRSVTEITYSRSFTFTVDGGEITLDQVDDVGLDDFHSEENGTEIVATTTFVRIEFDEVDGADSYEVFGRYSEGTNEYILLNSFEIFDADDAAIEYGVTLNQTSIDVPEDGFFDNGSFFLIVRAKSGDVYGEFSDEFEIEEGDVN